MTDEQPTSQFPVPPPGGAAPTPPTRRSRRTLIAAVVAFVVVLGAGIGIAVAVGTDGDDGLPLGAPSSTTAGSPGAASPSSGKKKNGKKKNGTRGKNTVIRGTVTSEAGATWTVKTRQGKTVKVTVGADTRFGTKQSPAKVADFPVGHEVAIVGPPATGDTVTARRVRTPVAKKGGTSPVPGATPSPSPSSS